MKPQLYSVSDLKFLVLPAPITATIVIISKTIGSKLLYIIDKEVNHRTRLFHSRGFHIGFTTECFGAQEVDIFFYE